MKKILTLLVAIFAFATLSQAQTKSFSMSTGYSWSYGVIGGEYQFGLIGIGAGWMPSSMFGSHDRISSLSAVVTGYSGLWNQTSGYLAAAFTSKGYHSKPLGIVSSGFKYNFGNWLDLPNINAKAGAGIGFCKNYVGLRFEGTVSWSFRIN